MRRLLVILCLLLSVPSFACRFTVREIGFTNLSQSTYTFVILDNGVENAGVLTQLQSYGKDSNIGVVHLNVQRDSINPIVRLAKKMQVKAPSIFMVSPSNEILTFKESDSWSVTSWETVRRVFLEKVIDSPLRKRLREDIERTYAYVLSIDGGDDTKSERVASFANEACRQIDEIMPLMPKQVDKAPSVVRLMKGNVGEEEVLLWSLGVKQYENEPQAVIIYGRGRVMGDKLNYHEIEDSLIYKYLSMIGADCECGLDRKWMLGMQVPMLWDKASRQDLALELGFDVDNPSILAEMSRILAKEKIDEIGVGVGYGLESIDLNKVFADKKPDPASVIENDDGVSSLEIIIISLVGLIVISLIISWIIIKNK